MFNRINYKNPKKKKKKKKTKLNDIPKLVHEYTNQYSNYIYYRWVQQSSLLKGSSHSNSAIGCIFLILLTWHILKYIPIAYTSTTNVTLDWKEFVAFYELLISYEEVQNYAIEHYPNLTYF
jgi:hypothetical protein